MTKTETASQTTPSQPTRQRLLDSALELFAAQGYEGTSVGEIEQAAGLVPRSGALYKHFPSKRALLGAALADRMDEVDRIDARIDMLPRGGEGDLGTDLSVVKTIDVTPLGQGGGNPREEVRHGGSRDRSRD